MSLEEKMKKFVDQEMRAGRLLIRTSVFTDGFFHHGGKIVKVSPQMVSYTTIPRYKGEESVLKRISHSNVAMVCDTMEEYNAALQFEFDKRVERNELVKKQRQECKERFSV